MAVNVGGDTVACHPLDGSREVLRRYVQPLGIVAYIALRATDARGEQSHELFHNIGRAVGMALSGITLGMCLEDVVHHRETEAAHQFAVKLMVAVTHAVAQSMEVL